MLCRTWFSHSCCCPSSSHSATDQQLAKPPDVIFLNGDIYTQATPARAQAIAVRDGRIVAIGTNDEIRKLKGKPPQVIDLGGHFVMPGFNDAHCHLAFGGLEQMNVNLVGSKSLQEMQQRLPTARKPRPPATGSSAAAGTTRYGPSQKLPTRQDLDAVTSGHPAIFVRVDGHIAIANSAALQAGGHHRADRAPAGRCDRPRCAGTADGHRSRVGAGSGLIQGAAPTPAQRRRAAELALANAARSGITSAQDNSDWEDFLVYEEMEREGKLTLRISEWLRFNDSVELLEKHRAHHPATIPCCTPPC